MKVIKLNFYKMNMKLKRNYDSVQSMFEIYKDYLDYKNDIFIYKNINNIIDYHRIVIIGWSEENVIKYWIIKKF